MRAALVSRIAALALIAATVGARAEPVPWLGITYRPHRGGGAEISEVHPGSAAASAGLRGGDVILAIDGDDVYGSLGPLIGRFGVGDRAPMVILREGRELRVAPRLRARPTSDEIVHQRLVGHDLPDLPLHDARGGAVSSADWRDRPVVMAIFDAKCDACAAAVSQLADRVSAAGVDVSVDVWVLAQSEELAALLARVPLPARARGIDRLQAASLIGGLEDAIEGAIAVVDHEGVIRYAAATSAGERGCDEAARVARRVVDDWSAAR